MASAIWVWGLAGVTGSRVLLRIEDHDRERSRPEHDAAILEDLTWLGFVADAGPVRQQGESATYEAALGRLREGGLAYACDCTRSTFATWTTTHEGPWRGPGCPGNCRARHLVDDMGSTVRVALGTAGERWEDRILGPQGGDPSSGGDLPVRDRHGNWTYGFAVVVDDIRQGISLVVRGEDLVDATPGQICLARMLGRREPAAFAHHPLIRKHGGAKLSKADGDSGVRDLRAAGQRPAEVIGAAAAAVGLIPVPVPLDADAVQRLFEG